MVSAATADATCEMAYLCRCGAIASGSGSVAASFKGETIGCSPAKVAE